MQIASKFHAAGALGLAAALFLTPSNADAQSASRADAARTGSATNSFVVANNNTPRATTIPATTVQEPRIVQFGARPNPAKETGPNYEIVHYHYRQNNSKTDTPLFVPLMDGNEGKLVIINYSEVGTPNEEASQKQYQWLKEKIAKMAQISKAPIILVDARTLTVDRENKAIYSGYGESLMALLKLSPLKTESGGEYEFGKTRLLVPYGEITVPNKETRHFSYNLYVDSTTDPDRRKAILWEVQQAINSNNAAIASNFDATKLPGTLGARQP